MQRRTLPGRSIESLLSQSFGDFELIISDNASLMKRVKYVETIIRRTHALPISARKTVQDPLAAPQD